VFFFDTVPQCISVKWQRSKFVQGTLYYLAGMLKIEARNYFLTKQKYDSDFAMVGNLATVMSEHEKPFIVDLSKNDL
jgi:hypothetical protein